jgi:hypothetical protein
LRERPRFALGDASALLLGVAVAEDMEVGG